MESAVFASSSSVSQSATNSHPQPSQTTIESPAEEAEIVSAENIREKLPPLSLTLTTTSASTPPTTTTTTTCATPPTTPTSATSPSSTPESPKATPAASLTQALIGSVRPSLDLSKLYKKPFHGYPFYNSDSSSSNSLSTMLSPEVVTNLALLDTDTDRMLENFNKISIHHQDAEVSLADATDCLRHIGGKLDWYHRKQVFCPHLMTCDDAVQIASLQQKILYEEIPFLELKNRLKEAGDSCDFPRELEGRFLQVCGLFIELKNRIEDLISALPDELISPIERNG